MFVQNFCSKLHVKYTQICSHGSSECETSEDSEKVEDYPLASLCVSLLVCASVPSLSRLSLLLPHLQTRAEERGFLQDFSLQ